MSIGKISEFKVATDNWKLYVERLQQYFVVNKIPSDLHVPTLITVMGAECYELLVDLCTPAKPTSKTFTELTNVLEKHLQPKPSILAERYKFRHRQQKQGEGLAEYVAVLKSMSKTCEFGNWLEESLRDQFICGIISETIRQRLFAEDNLDFSKAYRLAVSLEAAEKNAAIVEGPAGLPSAKEKTAECQAMAGSSQKKAGFGSEAANRGGYRARYSGQGQGARGSSQVHRSARSVPGVPDQARSQQCKVCGHQHSTTSCRFRSYTCRVCNRQGHLRRMCPNLAEQHCLEAPYTTSVAMDSSEDSDEVIITNLNKLSIQQCKPIVVTLNVNGINISMECDTGSAVSCISHEVYKQLFSDLDLHSCQLRLRYYTGECVAPVGVLRPLVKYKQKEKHLDLYVVRHGKTNLLGRQWLMELNIKLPDYECSVNSLKDDFNIKDFSSRYCNVFADGLGRFTGGLVGIRLRADARPVFMRARPLAYALREPVERALEQLVSDGILTPVDHSDWATPIVPVIKKDGSIRICADYKLTLNKNIEVDRFPLPRVEDLLARLHGGERFSKIDLSQAYAQFELDESKKCTVINTHKGLFMYNRLVYGLSSSPGIFQKRLESLFADLPHVGVFLDDIIITGKDRAEHIENLHRVFGRLQAYGLRVKKEKCEFFAESINYLGYVISKKGVHTCPNKIKAIINIPAPTNVSELRAFIGMIMYYAKFIKNVSTILAPLYNLLRGNVRFIWCRECKKAFEDIKRLLGSSDVLAHYSPELPLVLTVDASCYGVGAVISHITQEGERPIAYASRTLSASERAYAQIDREALAIVYGIRKFHQYLYGRHFTLRTDHKPLTYIFGDKAGIPVMAASRLQRWAVLLSGYDYKIEFVASSKNCADALSRLPQKKNNEAPKNELTYLNFVENFLPITNEKIRNATVKDTVLSRILLYTQSGWPVMCSDEVFKPYFMRRQELYLDRGCIMWGYRVVIPQVLRNDILKQLHVSHMGIVKTKSLARSYVWWPGIDSDIEGICKECETCASEASAPPRAPPRPWPYTPEAWSRIHIDFLGPYKSRTFFVIIDSSTKWIEIFEMSRTNASAVIKNLRATFARFGLPKEVVSDQGPPFTSSEFKNFLAGNGIIQSFSPTYHPASNGAAENAVKLCKRAVKKAYRDKVDVDAALQTFLLAYRNSIHGSTGDTPAMLLQRRSLRSRLDLLRPTRGRESRVLEAQKRQVENAGGVPRQVVEGEDVWARAYGGSDKWIKSKVIRREDTRRYALDTGEGRIVHRHIDQIRRRSRLSDIACPPPEEEVSGRDGGEAAVTEPVVVPKEGPPSDTESKEILREVSTPDTEGNAVTTPLAPQPLPERRKRIRKPVIRFGLDPN